ncbi:MAG TPA: acylphosphatase [Allosphingosinicella sp.]|nr:acylphosphatase [Allosphingosinicella sp.]
MKRLRVHGSVQGVFYRAWTVETARALGLSGWVRNRRDGSVEIVAAGPEEALARLVEACRRGPPSAQVERIDVEDTDEAVPRTFEKRPTL